MTSICGVDGCKAGWIVIDKDLETGQITWHQVANVQELICEKYPHHIIAIDIPIGLTDSGPRTCDQEARKLLGPGRASSVFPAPVRPILTASSYQHACEIRFQIEGKKISKQTWAIVPKIREVDDVLKKSPGLQYRVREVHPEVSFYKIAGGQPMKFSKKKSAGKDERRELLAPIYGHWLVEALAKRRFLSSAEDDILDAFIALWTAERIAMRQAQTIPTEPPKDPHGLRMEIVI